MSNYIIEKHSKTVIWINPDPNKLTGVETWGNFDPTQHEVVYALNYNPQIGDVFKADVEDGVAKEFVPTKVYNKTSGQERVLQSWEDQIDSETETEDEPSTDAAGIVIPNQIYTKSGWILDFEKLKDLAIRTVNSICTWWICNGFSSNALGSVHYYNSDRDDQINLLGLASLETSEMLKCAADSITKKEYVLHTSEQLKKVLMDGASRKKFLLHKVAELKTKISNTTTIAELKEIDIDTGWDLK
ncbi:hypothetical protein [Leptospira alexanderi]|uniref:hypothetical protein n=1 Tax=Leptospira alexanderi TaxID=100053 RepID=UPI000990CF9B|nr:hypothetical protein [Leptospira alexanderi]